MKNCIKTLEIKAIEYRFDAESYDYVLNISGCWVPHYVTYDTYEEAIAVMKASKRLVAKGMNPDIATRIVSVHAVFTGEPDADRHQIHPNSPFWRRQRRLAKQNDGRLPFETVAQYVTEENSSEEILDF